MKKLSCIVGAILLILGAILLFAGRSFVIPAFSEPVDLMEGGIEELSPGTAVEAELTVVLERFSCVSNMFRQIV